MTETSNLDAGADFIAFDLLDEEEKELAASTDEKKSLLQKAKTLGQSLRDKLGKGEKRKREAHEREDASGIDYNNTFPWVIGKNYSDEREAVDILHREILDFVAYISPTPMEHATRQYVINRIKNIVTKHWKDTKVCVFGSFDTCLYLPMSDIDLVVLSNGSRVYETPRDLRDLANKLTREGIAKEMQVIAKASVPIIKFVEPQTRIRVDISFNKPGGLVSAAIVKEFLAKYPAARWLIMIIKHFLSMRGINEVYAGGLGSYAVTCIVISFLQLHPQIASERIQAHHNLGVLLIEFLELYGKRFNYDSVGISIDGRGSYFSKVDMGWIRPNQPYLLSIRDPNDATNDIAKASHQILKVRSTLSAGYDLLVEEVYEIHSRISEIRRSRRSKHRTGSISLLKCILAVNRDIYKTRDHIALLWEKEEITEVPFLADEIPTSVESRLDERVKFVTTSTSCELEQLPTYKQSNHLSKARTLPSQVTQETTQKVNGNSHAYPVESITNHIQYPSKSKFRSEPVEKPPSRLESSRRRRPKGEKEKVSVSHHLSIHEQCTIDSSSLNAVLPTNMSMEEDSRYGAIEKLGKKSNPILLD